MDRGAEIGTIPEEAFSFDGYQVVRGEFFAHTFEPSITFCGSKLYVNMACQPRYKETRHPSLPGG